MNGRDYTITIKRNDICDLLIACTVAGETAPDGGEKWERLHDKLAAILDSLDNTIEG